ncbi:ABC transporter ATP-binding protein [Liquorilactobacillus cacaonum]|uniref:ABC transporter, ATP-binding protein n=1 Tax=Liquorilactobacillus cacaonum DSM 21116 TaxID=1423729 RepID=A0A0R2CE28_9LACO|nr:ABC transporter ATP-binding protein [Liquorilactobacillus cacaonum]KRM89985.1 ABC transporter, ATP-binding protein [Liquorilactobacillus cacaonum DSM 21116]
MLKVEGLEKNFGNKKVLKGLSFRANSHEITGLIGKNGAGKTTIFHSILKFINFDGKILFNGEPITKDVYREIGYLPEERSLMPKLTVFQQVRFLASLKGMSVREIRKELLIWMDKLEVKGSPDDKIKSLSKGNQQKIQLICTLIHRPKLIILDEPFSGLDPVNTDLLKEIILDERRRGATIVFSDHDMTNVEELCDKLIMISNGEIVLNGEIQEIRLSFGSTKIFVQTNLSMEQLQSIDHVTSVKKTKYGTYQLDIEDEKYGEEIFNIITGGKYVKTFDQQPPTLNEIFKMEARR